jgi:superfamily II DNA/RNA helicase
MPRYQQKRTSRPGGRSSFGGGQQRRNSGGSRPAGKGRQPKKDYIHPSRFIRVAKPVAEEVYVPLHSFADFELEQLLKDNLQKMGFEQPSPIQDQTIPLGLQGNDILGIANTGTGKTAAFALPVLNRLIKEPTSRAIIMAPTRELAQQIEEQCRVIAKGSGLTGALLIGGAAMGPQLRDLRTNPRIVIGTPGRIKDHMERGSLKLHDCNVIVLDEVDRMLDMGFVNDITTILSNTSEDKQSFYFSATLDKRVQGIIENFSHEPVQVSIKSGETSDNVHQDVILAPTNGEKIEKLHDLLINESTTKTIIFDDTQRSVDRLSQELANRGFSVDSIHGGKNQSQRSRILKKFKTNDITVLVATDVAARGLDVSDITHVVNFNTPQTYDDYVHRIGRTGRAGKVGYAFTFIDRV